VLKSIKLFDSRVPKFNSTSMEWRWSGVNVKTSGGGGMNDLIMELKWS
jgi:hypothetical protein